MIDHSLYPDIDDSGPMADAGERADYLARVCGAWDFGILPSRETFGLLASWRDVFDQFPLPASPAYHALRALYKWPRVPGAAPSPSLAEIEDAQAGRSPDSAL